MSYTSDPMNRMSDRIRLIVGDTDIDNEGLSDREYEYIILKNTTDNVVDENKASIQALNYLLAKYANYATEKTGDLFIKYDEIYKNYKELLNRYTRDPRTSLFEIGVGYTGGIYCNEIMKNIQDGNTRNTEFYLGWSTDAN